MTRQQLVVLDFIRNHMALTGVAPTYGEMSRHFRWAGHGAAARIVGAMVQAGYLMRGPAYARRSLRIADDGADPRLIPTDALIAELERRGVEVLG